MSRRTKVSESPVPRFGSEIYEASPAPPGRRQQRGGAVYGASMSPSPSASNSSDKENRSTHAGPEKEKGRSLMPPPRQPSGLSDSSMAPKRRRVETEDADGALHHRKRLSTEPEEDERDNDDDDDQYDPDQDIMERRRLRKGLRALTKDLNDNRAEYLNATSTGLLETLRKANDITVSVKQTADATIDSRLLVTAADLSYRKTVQLTLGDSIQGVDVDEFVSKCITLMRRADAGNQGGEPAPSNTQRRRRRMQDEDGDLDSDDDDGDMMNWEALGKVAMPCNLRPAVPGFLLGPLSLERRVRKPIQRRAGLKHSSLKQTQPEILDPGDIEKAENANLTVLCTRILARLKKVQADGEGAVEAEATEDMSESDLQKLMFRHGVHAQGGVDFFKFVINPWSFGQTVENLFYVSFLIRDGKVGITIDDDGLPAVEATEPRGRAEAAEQGVSKHQAILDIDMDSWQNLVDTFDIKEPMIPHREEVVPANVGSRGWYS
ncbi:MAG: nuclear protein [Claussenomyces sp. TS43310]|nr:MAG: nuclear protein [Claussenomyces sp. TS43310]